MSDVLYLRKENRATKIVYQQKEEIILKSLNSYFDDILIRYLTNFEGREKATKKYYKIGQYVPIYLNNNEIYQPLFSKKYWDQIYINFSNVEKLLVVSEQETTIVFNNKKTLDVNLPLNHIQRLFENCLKIKKDQLKSIERNFYNG